MRTVVRQAPGRGAAHRRPGEDPAEARELTGTDLRAHVALLGELSEEDKAAFPAVGRRLLRPQPAGGVLRRRSSSRPSPPGRRSSPATWTRSPACWSTGRPACWSAAATRRPWPGRCASCSPTRRGARSSRARGAEVAAGYDWDVLARRILAVYETVVLPDGGEVTAGDDDDFPADAPTGAWSSFLRSGAAASLTSRDARRLAADGRRRAAGPRRLDRLDPDAAAAARGPGRPGVDRPSTRSCSGGPGWPRSWPATFPAAVGEDRADYLAAFAADARAARSTATASWPRTCSGGSSGSCPPSCPASPAALRTDLAGTATRVGAGPPVLQRRRPRHPGPAAAPAAPRAAPARRAGRCPGTSTSTTASGTSPARTDGAGNQRR